MVGYVNKAILLGTLGRDPEVRTFQNGDRVVTFSMATTESWRDKTSGERKSRTEWHNVEIRNEQIGKIAEQYLSKGSSVFIEGQIHTREFTDKDGNQRKVTEIVVPRFGGSLTLVGDPKTRQSEPSEQRGEQPAQRGSLKDQLVDEVPF